MPDESPTVEAEIHIVALRRTSREHYDQIQVPAGSEGMQNVSIGRGEIIGYAPFFVDDEGRLMAWAIVGHERLNRADYPDFQWPQTPEEALAQWHEGTPVGEAPTRTGYNARMRSVGLEAQFTQEPQADAE